MRVRYWFIAAAILAAGCGGKLLLINGIEVRENYWKEAVRSLEGRASSEMQCPTTSLDFLLLQRDGRDPTQITVSGCGKQATYVRSLVRRKLTDWTLSSASWTAPAALPLAPAPSAPTPATSAVGQSPAP